jgi:hypothetical protein
VIWVAALIGAWVGFLAGLVVAAIMSQSAE